MARIGVVVEFTIKPGQHATMVAMLRDHARLTLAEEPGCERFDLMQPMRDGSEDASRLILCEVYRDQAAFDLHVQNPRLARVREAYAAMIEDRRFSLCTL